MLKLTNDKSDWQTEGENISKLEKADILELTVRHLQKLQASRPTGLSTTIASGDEVSAENRWQSGFGHCATEACRFLSSLPGEAAERLARHLAAGLQTSRHTNSSVIIGSIRNYFGRACRSPGRVRGSGLMRRKFLDVSPCIRTRLSRIYRYRSLARSSAKRGF